MQQGADTPRSPELPPDVPGLLPRELKRTRLQMLSLLGEDLKYFRNLRRERDRRSVSR